MTNTEQPVIQLEKIGGLVFLGRKKGAAAREKFGLDETDQLDSEVQVVIPPKAFSVSPSFLLGLFEKSIQAAGTRDAFLSHYVIKAPDRFWGTIDESIARALENSVDLLTRRSSKDVGQSS